MAEQRELLKKQLAFLQKSRTAAEKALALFEQKKQRLKQGQEFESAKKAFEAVHERTKGIDEMIARVQKEISLLSEEPREKKKEKKQAKKKKARKKK